MVNFTPDNMPNLDPKPDEVMQKRTELSFLIGDIDNQENRDNFLYTMRNCAQMISVILSHECKPKNISTRQKQKTTEDQRIIETKEIEGVEVVLETNIVDSVTIKAPIDGIFYELTLPIHQDTAAVLRTSNEGNTEVMATQYQILKDIDNQRIVNGIMKLGAKATLSI